MKIGQRVKAINKKFSHYGDYGTIMKKNVSTIIGEKVEIKFDNGLSGLFSEKDLQVLSNKRDRKKRVDDFLNKKIDSKC